MAFYLTISGVFTGRTKVVPHPALNKVLFYRHPGYDEVNYLLFVGSCLKLLAPPIHLLRAQLARKILDFLFKNMSATSILGNLPRAPRSKTFLLEATSLSPVRSTGQGGYKHGGEQDKSLVGLSLDPVLTRWWAE